MLLFCFLLHAQASQAEEVSVVGQVGYGITCVASTLYAGNAALGMKEIVKVRGKGALGLNALAATIAFGGAAIAYNTCPQLYQSANNLYKGLPSQGQVRDQMKLMVKPGAHGTSL